jgi:CRP-like cAMP-binding protein
LGPGECVGEMAVISRHGQARTADVVAEGEAEIITIGGEALEKASDACRMHFYQSFLDVVSSRLASATERYASV